MLNGDVMLFKNYLTFFFIATIIVVSMLAPAYSSPNFVYKRTPTLENSFSATTTISPQVVVNGTNAYFLFIDETGTDIIRLEKTNVNSPTTYNGVNAYDGGGTIFSFPQLFVDPNSNNVFAAFYEDVDPDFYLNVIKSSDGGATFTAFDFSSTFPDGAIFNAGQSTGENLKITVDSGTDNYYVAFINSGKLQFLSDTYDEDGLFGGTLVDVNGTNTGVTNLDMIKNGTNVYLAYEVLSGGVKEIGFARSTNSGTSWTLHNLSNSTSVESSEPKLSLSGNNVYVTWQENTLSNSEIHFIKFDALNTTFGSNVRLDDSGVTSASLTPQIASSGNNVYVVWSDKIDAGSTNQEIVLRKSSDSGGTFASTVSISSSTGESINPKISAQGTNLNVVWQDKTIDGTNGELWLRSSSDSGATFGGLQIISESPASYTLPTPEISSSSAASAVVWKKSAFGGQTFAKPANATNIDVSFNKIEYAKTDSATITVKDTSKSGSVDVGVIVDAGTDHLVTLTETGTLGTFTNSIDIDAAPYSASDGSKIRVNYPTSSGNFTSFSHVLGTRSIAWSPNPATLIAGNLYGITVNDASANTNPFAIDTISVSLTTTSVGGATTLDTDTVVLSETDLNSGIFSSSQNIVFMPGDISPSISDTVTITSLNDTSVNDLAIQTNSRLLNSTSFPAGVVISLTETSLTSNQYTATISFCGIPGCSDAATKKIYAKAGDFFGITLLDGTEKTYGVIDPMLSTRRALIINDNLDSEVDLSYNGLSVLDRTISDAFSPGGGGGGVSRAGLVVQAVGAIALFGGGSSHSGPPSFDSGSFTVIKEGEKISSSSLSANTASLTVGKQSDISMGFKLPGGINDLDHIGLYANIGNGQNKFDSDTYIYFDRFKNPQITIHDPHGFFKSVDMDVTEPTKGNIDANFVFDFAKSLDNSNVVFEAWNINRDSATKEIPDLLKVVDTTKPDVSPETETITPTTQEKPPVPDWVKNNAAWWGKGEIDDNEFTNGIGFLIQNQIIDVPELMKKNTSPEKVNPDTGVLEQQDKFTPVVPDWVKNNASWWSEGKLTDNEFLVGIKYLLEQGIIQVRV